MPFCCAASVLVMLLFLDWPACGQMYCPGALTCSACNIAPVGGATCGWCQVGVNGSCIAVTLTSSSGGSYTYSANCSSSGVLSVSASACPSTPAPSTPSPSTLGQIQNELSKVPYWAWIILGGGLGIIIIISIVLCCKYCKCCKSNKPPKTDRSGTVQRIGEQDKRDKASQAAALQAIMGSKPTSSVDAATAAQQRQMREYVANADHMLLINDAAKPDDRSTVTMEDMGPTLPPMHSGDMTAAMLDDADEADDMQSKPAVAPDDIDVLLQLQDTKVATQWDAEENN